MIYLLNQNATPQQIRDMLEVYPRLIKIAVDIRQKILVGGGEMNADCESILIDHGSEQDDIWGANWYPFEQRVEYEALINIRPRLGNRSMIIQSEEIRQIIKDITMAILGGVV